MVGGGGEYTHSTDIESTYRVIFSVLAFTLKVSRGPISVEYLFSMADPPGGSFRTSTRPTNLFSTTDPPGGSLRTSTRPTMNFFLFPARPYEHLP